LNSTENQDVRTPGRTARGALIILTGIAWGVLCGLLIQLFLPRSLDPASYARFAVASSVIVWLEAAGCSLIVRACSQFAASHRENWPDVVRTGLFVSLLWGGLLAVALFATAPTVASWLGDPALVPLLRLFAMDAPLFSSVAVTMGVLQGRRRYASRAAVTVVYWGAKVILTVAFVLGGLSETGAIFGSIAASVVGLVLGFRLTGRFPRPVRGLIGRMLWFGVPVAIGLVIHKFVISVDLWTVKALNPDADAAGFYAIAQYAASVPLFIAMAVAASATPALVQAWERGGRGALRRLVHGQYRFVLILSVPLVVIVLTDGPSLFSFLFSPPYESSARAARFLVPGTALFAVAVVGGNVLIAARRNWLVVVAVGSALLLQLLLLVLLGEGGDLSRVGTATLITGAVLAVVMVAQVRWVAGVGPGWGTVLRVSLAGLAVTAASLLWRPEGVLLLPKGAALGILFLGLLLALGEIRKQEVLSLLGRGR